MMHRWTTPTTSMLCQGLVKTVSIFDEDNDQLTTATRNEILFNLFSPVSDRNKSSLVEAVASKIRHRDRLSVFFLIEDQQFFKSCHLSYAWDRLRSLMLTWPLLKQGGSQKRISRFLYKAQVRWRFKMPRSRTMVLWNFQLGGACAAIFCQDCLN